MATGDQWVHFDDFYAMEASQLRRYEDLVDDLNRAKYG